MSKWTPQKKARLAAKRAEIVRLLREGKTSWEISKMGFTFATARYHERKLFKPKQHAKFMKKHSAKQKEKRLSLSTQGSVD